MLLLIVLVLTMRIILCFIPPRENHYNWIKLVGIRVGVAKFDVDYGVDLSVQ